jgi:hypothetical protein
MKLVAFFLMQCVVKILSSSRVEFPSNSFTPHDEAYTEYRFMTTDMHLNMAVLAGTDSVHTACKKFF